MGKTYRTAMGKVIDIDALRLSNEATIALGNMKVNARGDELGPGGKVVKSRNQLMDEYYKLNTPTAVEIKSVDRNDEVKIQKPLTTPMVEELPPPAEPVTPEQAKKLKGSLANAFAKNKE